MTRKNNSYDAIIIGSGIGGLVCGCYLAKTGLKVIMIEKHTQAGGYCTSFFRDGYSFDAAVHSLRGLKEKNQLGIVFKDLNLNSGLSFLRINPSDIILYKGEQIKIFNNIKDTENSFAMAFPQHTKEIKNFFHFVSKTDFYKIYKLTYGMTFKEMLDHFFRDERLKTFFAILLGNLGIDQKYISALSALVLYNELLSDGGYYPTSGRIQSFADALAKKFKDLNGTLKLGVEAKKIIIENGIAKGIILESGEIIKSKITVSNIDAIKTYLDMIGDDKIDLLFRKRLSQLSVSPSAFIVYAGLKNASFNNYKCCTLWYFPSEKSAGCYRDAYKGVTDSVGNHAIFGLSSPYLNRSNKISISLTSITPWKDKDYWRREKDVLTNKMFKIMNRILGVSSDDIKLKMIATPLTLQKYTYNHKGALYGWASVPGQISKWTNPQKSIIGGLFLCGHWATRGWGQGGVSMVANSGRTTAEMILKLHFK